MSVVAPPAPAFQAVTLTNSTLRLTWTTEAGNVYQLQDNSDLDSTNWINLGSCSHRNRNRAHLRRLHLERPATLLPASSWQAVELGGSVFPLLIESDGRILLAGWFKHSK